MFCFLVNERLVVAAVHVLHRIHLIQAGKFISITSFQKKPLCPILVILVAHHVHVIIAVVVHHVAEVAVVVESYLPVEIIVVNDVHPPFEVGDDLLKPRTNIHPNIDGMKEFQKSTVHLPFKFLT